MKHCFMVLLLCLGLFLAIPAGATGPDLIDDQTEAVTAEVVEPAENGPTELEYLESINTYAMYLFAFGVFWVILTLCSLVYKLLRIFI